jgi:hypothetical protein
MNPRRLISLNADRHEAAATAWAKVHDSLHRAAQNGGLRGLLFGFGRPGRTDTDGAY